MEPNTISVNTSAPAPKKIAKTAFFILIIVILVVVGLFAYAFTLKPISDNAESMASTTASSTPPIVAANTDDTDVKSTQFTVRISTSTKTANIDFPDGHTTQVPIYWEDWEFFMPYIEIVDVNFDGHDDILESYTVGAYNMSANFYVQDPATRKFSEYSIGLSGRDEEGNLDSGLGMTSFNAEKRQITSYWKGRGLGDLYTLETFDFRNGKWELAKTENQDWLGPNDNGYYIREIVEYDGAISSTTTTYWRLDGDEGGGTFKWIEISKEEAMKHVNDVRGG